MVRMSGEDRLLQAMTNVGNTYKGATKTLLDAIVKEVRRLERWEIDQENREYARKQREREKEFKATGKWPEGDDDIPF